MQCVHHSYRMWIFVCVYNSRVISTVPPRIHIMFSKNVHRIMLNVWSMCVTYWSEENYYRFMCVCVCSYRCVFVRWKEVLLLLVWPVLCAVLNRNSDTLWENRQFIAYRKSIQQFSKMPMFQVVLHCFISFKMYIFVVVMDFELYKMVLNQRFTTIPLGQTISYTRSLYN